RRRRPDECRRGTRCAAPPARRRCARRGRYDDGAYSGGTMDRPALQRLLDDIRGGKPQVTGADVRNSGASSAESATHARVPSNHLSDALGEPRPMSAQGGPLPFPGDAGRQVSCPNLPTMPSEADSWITKVPAAKASDSAFVRIYT